MIVDEFDLDFYQKANGECPVGDFLSSLNNVMRHKMMLQFDKLELYGNQPKGDFSKNLGDGIFEVRAQTRTDISRVLFFFDRDRKIVLTHGFIKKTQRLPVSELETAKRYRADYVARSNALANEQKTPVQNQKAPSPRWRPKLEDIMKDAQSKSVSQSKSIYAKKESPER